MSLEEPEIVQRLMQGFKTRSARGLPLCVAFVWGDTAHERCTISLSQGEAKIVPGSHSELSLIFSSESRLRELLSGQCTAVELFMRGDFRTDGGLPFVPHLLNAFTAAN